MKKGMRLCLAVLLIFCLAGTALAEEFILDPYAKFGNMELTWYQGYTPVLKNNTMTLHLPLRAENCVGDITVSFALADPQVLLLAAEPKPITVSPKDGLYPVTLTLPLAKNRRCGDYPAVITVTGKDSNGKEISETIPYIIRIRDGNPTHEIFEPVFSDIKADLNLGEDGTLELTLTNPTTTLSAADCCLFFKDPRGDIRLMGVDRIDVPEILPGESLTVTLPVTVKGNAEVAIHDVELTFSCRVLDRESQWSRTFSVPVTQEIRLEQGGVQLPDTFPGELTTMTLPLMNLGKADVRNVLVKLEMEGVLDPQSVLVGTLSPGETKQAKLTFTPKLDAQGLYTGTVTVTGEDAYGNGFYQTLAVSLTVEEPLLEPGETEAEEKENLRIGTLLLVALCVLLAAGMILQRILLTQKLHRLEEETL